MHHRHQRTYTAAVSRTARYITSTQHSDSEWIPASARGEPPITPPRRSNTDHARGDGCTAPPAPRAVAGPTAPPRGVTTTTRAQTALVRRPDHVLYWYKTSHGLHGGRPGRGQDPPSHRLFGLENVEMLDAVDMLDLDSAMKRHPEYSEERPAELYGKIDAYNWANERVERRFQKMLRQPRKEDGRGRFVCFDGTGTRVKRQIRRMREAREAGFDVVQLYVGLAGNSSATEPAARPHRAGGGPQGISRSPRFCGRSHRATPRRSCGCGHSDEQRLG